MQLNESLIRERAYKIWESEGRPNDCAEKHWQMACEALQADQPGDIAQTQLETKSQSDTFIPHQNTKKGKHAHHSHQPH
jgi:hypothetical protein